MRILFTFIVLLILFPYFQPIIDAFKKHRNQHVIFTNANKDKNIKEIINLAAGKKRKSVYTETRKNSTIYIYIYNLIVQLLFKDKHRQDPSRYPFVSVMVVGMPNVGKSSLINSMRRIGVHKGKIQ